ncbi:hypothetical protein SMACR_09474 [Sordaria macrospora]|uniref:WGS project CABT00000000 data, contig 2.62 n=2 Tax=Sordaria macrospora TaxID=5147 RepID=F7WAK9_SORMK|nr:uncharacterized protein SMAC_09474 [Sordaria macrospora k-hell]KAA8620642.1 hypothetical protein SMACR_09474 [Sordaria macrospora]WPJ62615.1 hypothetical protein SMAC4_09474 [Sordaria macrospora]CCC14204.1 unnamed protein product [Sordaria macrospora k-hell]
MADKPQPPPRKRYIQSMDDFWRLEKEALNPPENGAATPVDLPKTNEERMVWVDQLITSFRNMSNICDSTADNHGHIRFVREELTDKDAERMAWKILAEMEACESRSASHAQTRIIKAVFKDFTTRMRIFLAVMDCCKAAVANLFQPSIVERFVYNPVTELNTKLSNLHTNQIKAHNVRIADAVKKHGSASFDHNTCEVKDGNGRVLVVLPRPQKRRIAEFFPADLLPHAKAKRAYRRRVQAPANNQSDADNEPNGDNNPDLDNHPSGNNEHIFDDEHDDEGNAANILQDDNEPIAPNAQPVHVASGLSVNERAFISSMVNHELGRAGGAGSSPFVLQGQGNTGHQTRLQPADQASLFAVRGHVFHHHANGQGGPAGVGSSSHSHNQHRNGNINALYHMPQKRNLSNVLGPDAAQPEPKKAKILTATMSNGSVNKMSMDNANTSNVSVNNGSNVAHNVYGEDATNGESEDDSNEESNGSDNDSDKNEDAESYDDTDYDEDGDNHASRDDDDHEYGDNSYGDDDNGEASDNGESRYGENHEHGGNNPHTDSNYQAGDNWIDWFTANPHGNDNGGPAGMDLFPNHQGFAGQGHPTQAPVPGPVPGQTFEGSHQSSGGAPHTAPLVNVDNSFQQSYPASSRAQRQAFDGAGAHQSNTGGSHCWR